MIETFFYRYSFQLLAATGTVAAWFLACWLVPSLAQLSFWTHVTLVAALLALNRIADRILDHDPALARVLVVPARVAMAAAFSALAGATALLCLIALSTVLDVIASPPVEAGTLAGHATHSWPAELPAALPLITFAAGSVAYGFARGHRRTVVVRHEIPVGELPSGVLRIVHVSDFHLGPMADRRCIRDAIDRVLALDPDLVCVTGDIVDSPAADIPRWMPELARLTARHGVFAILGNHDRNVGADRVAAALRRGTSWRVLRDEVATLELPAGRLHLVGLEDRSAPEAVRVLEPLLATLPAGEPAIVVAHRPSVFPLAAAANLPLTLAGHTHGGQVALPGAPHVNVARLLMGRYDGGLFTAGRSFLHVSRGIGVSGQPVRIGVPREIALLTLVGQANVDRASGGC